MDTTSVAKDIELLMGGNILNLEVSTEDIERFIKMAFNIMKPKICQDAYITVQALSFTDLRPYKVLEVIRVLPTQANVSGTSNGTALGDSGLNFGWPTSIKNGRGVYSSGTENCCGSVWNVHQGGSVAGDGLGTYLQSLRDDIINSYSVTETDIPFEFSGGVLMIPQGYATGHITAQCVIDLCIESLEDESAIKWIREYAHALTKETVGRIRSKFRTSSTPIENDGAELVNEAISDKDRLMSELNDKDYGPIYILR